LIFAQFYQTKNQICIKKNLLVKLMTFSNTLLILNSKVDININFDSTQSYVYCINSGKLTNHNTINLNSYKKFHKIAFEIKNKYRDIIGNLKKYFENDYKFHGNNLFYFTEISCKRTEYLKNFDYICHILLIKSILKEKNIDRILYYNTPVEFINTINSFSNVNNLILKKYINTQYYFYKIFTRQIFFALKMLFIKLISFFYFKKKINITNNYYFSTYPKNFNFENHIKYRDFVKNNSTYILSFLTDNVHQTFKIFNFLNIIKNLKKNLNNKFILSDSFINFADFFFFIKVNYICFGIFKKKINNHKINNIDFSNILKTDLNKSFERLTRLFVISLSYQRLAKNIKHKANFNYYLFEYPYGRMLSLSFYNENINRIGFQHGPTGYLKMICFLSEEDKHYIYLNNLNPNIIMVEDKSSFEIYKYGNFLNLSIMQEIYRLKYLKNIKRTKIINNTYLIACGLHDGLMILNILMKSIKANPNVNYILKLHPKASNSKIISLVHRQKLKNLTIADKQIEYYLERIDKVFFTYTSVGSEAAFLGIDNEVIYSNFKLNESVFCKEEKFFN